MKNGYYFLGTLLACALLMANHHIPNAKLVSSKKFSADTLVYKTGDKTFRFVVYRGQPFKKSPYKDWEYHNPADGLSNGEQLLQFAQKESLTDANRSDQWVHIFPYYQLERPVSGKEYHQFVKYVRDSVLHLTLGKQMGATYTDKNGLERIKWMPSKKLLTYRDYFADLFYRTENLGYYDLDPQYFVYQLRLPFSPQQVPLSKEKYLKNPSKNATRRALIRPRYETRVYPDTFFWVHDSCLMADSAVANTLAMGYWSSAKYSETLPALVSKAQANAYVNWVAEHWIENRVEAYDLSAHGRFLPVRKGYHLRLDASALAHCNITNRDYQEFLLYCRDSMIRYELGDALGMMINNNDGTTRLNWDQSLKILDKPEGRNSLSHLLTPSEKGSYLDPKVLRFGYDERDQKAMEQEYQQTGSMHSFLAQRRIGSYVKRYEVMCYPKGSKFSELLSIDQLKLIKALDNDEPVEGINYQQARAYWHWQLREKLKRSPKSIGDFYIPTRTEWQQIKGGTPLPSKDLELPSSFQSFSYRVYMSTS